ncbi:hypothetical protein [Larsenimonas suaedae]|uniref:Uncharacterized protein n=1 Tax=Larsenimonas suaedae TaxID=1851019 RepID=A0ABU1GZQ8_9GAMM|nr:hypothetical protein [Larsenimonas suaedae]MCM2973484.1 hypothetical protein [Larsenimonas suaedae]MDR5897340.1 hypothetical protein [Larsenimonas suaedae]
MKIKNLFKRFQSKKQRFRDFKQEEFEELDLSKYVYPHFNSDEEASGPRVYAYHSTFLMRHEQFGALKQIVTENGFDLTDHDFDTPIVNRNNKAMALMWRNEFAGLMVVLITNCVALIDQVYRMRPMPPLPQNSFPDLDPDDYPGSLQGNIEYWCDYHWHPYWQTLTQDEKAALPLTEGWREFTYWHCEPGAWD